MAGIKLLPSRFPVSCTAGDDVTITLDVNDHLGANYSWTGATVVAPIVGHPTVTGFTVNATVDGTLVLSLTDAQTTALGADAGFEWSLSVTTAAATRTWCSGALSVSRPGRPGVTNTTTGTLTVAESTGTAVTIEVGAVGPAGVGVEAGGTTGQVLTKSSNTDYDTEWSTPAGGGDMLSSANLSDLADAATARTNLGLGSAAVLASTAFDAAGAASTAQAAAVATAAADATSKANAAAAAAIAASQPLDADLSALAAAGNSAVLAATTASFLTADETKLDGIEAGADVTDATNVNAAGAVMESDYNANTILAATADNTQAPLTVGASTIGGRKASGHISAMSAAEAIAVMGLGTAATTAATAYATAAQGSTADTAVQPARSISTTAPLTGGGDLSANRTLAVSAASDTAAGVVELATNAEALTGTDTSRALTAANVAYVVARQAEYATIAIGDETTAITTGTAKVTWRAPFALTLAAVRASLTTASSSGTPTFDINEGGTSVLSTKLTIDANELTSTTAATAAVISDSAIADDASLTIDVDTAGTGAAGAKITLYFTRNP